MSRRSLLCVLTALVILCSSLLVGCSDYRQIKPRDGDLTVVGHVGEQEVYLEELRFVAYTYRQMMTERYGDGIFEGEDKEYYLGLLKELVYANITADYAVLSLCGEVGIGMGETAILERLEKRMTETVEEIGGMGEYKRFLKENHLTDHMLRRSVEISLLESELMYIYVDDILLIPDEDEEIYEIVKDEFIVVRHIFVPHSEDGAKNTINDVKTRLDSGEDFGLLLDLYGKDEDMTSEGLFILDGYMTDDYESVAFGLRVGERSDVVEDEHGYYVIERLKMNTSQIMLKIDHLKELYQTYTFYSMIDERQATLTFVPTESGEEYMSDPFSGK